MCLKNLWCLLPTGCFKGYNLATAFHDVVGYGKTVSVRVCLCLSIHLGSETSPRPHLLFDSHVRVQEEDETSLPQKMRPSFFFIAVEAKHPGPLSTKHLRWPHCPTWLSHRRSLRKHIRRFHESPPLFSSPVLSEWSFSETDAVEEDKHELSARLRLMESRPSVPCLTWADKGLPSFRIEGYTISQRDRVDGRLGG